MYYKNLANEGDTVEVGPVAVVGRFRQCSTAMKILHHNNQLKHLQLESVTSDEAPKAEQNDSTDSTQRVNATPSHVNMLVKRRLKRRGSKSNDVVREEDVDQQQNGAAASNNKPAESSKNKKPAPAA